MKCVLVGIVAFVLGGALVGLISELSQRVRAAQQYVAARSGIYDPMRTALNDVLRTLDSGETALARAKLQMLGERWTAFMDGGPQPEQFAPLVQSLTTAPTTP